MSEEFRPSILLGRDDVRFTSNDVRILREISKGRFVSGIVDMTERDKGTGKAFYAAAVKLQRLGLVFIFSHSTADGNITRWTVYPLSASAS